MSPVLMSFGSSGSVIRIYEIAPEVVRNSLADIIESGTCRGFTTVFLFVFYHTIRCPDMEDPDPMWQPHGASKAPRFLLPLRSAILDMQPSSIGVLMVASLLHSRSRQEVGKDKGQKANASCVPFQIALLEAPPSDVQLHSTDQNCVM